MRLIDADSLMEALSKVSDQGYKHHLNRQYVIDLITNAPTVQREGWVSAFFEDDDKTVFCFEQYKPEHIVVVFDYAKGEFVQVIRPNADGTTSSRMYEPAAPTDTE